MSSPVRPLTGLYRHFLNGLPLVGAQIKIKLSVNDYDLEAGYPVEEITVMTTDTGHLPDGTTIWKTARGFSGAKVVFTEPDGFKWEAVIPDGDGPISVQELRAGGTAVTQPDTILSLIADTNLNDLKNVVLTEPIAGDALVYDDEAEKWINAPITTEPGNSFSGTPSYLSKFQGLSLVDSRISDNGDTINFAGKTKTVVQNPAHVGYSIQLASGQIANALQVEKGGGIAFSVNADGRCYADPGTATGIPGFAFAPYPLTGIGANGGNFVFYLNGNSEFNLSENLFRVRSNSQFSWASANSNYSYPDTGMARLQPGVVKITNGATGQGDIQTGRLYLTDGTVKEVLFGAPDSAGNGFKVLKIAN